MKKLTQIIAAFILVMCFAAATPTYAAPAQAGYTQADDSQVLNRSAANFLIYRLIGIFVVSGVGIAGFLNYEAKQKALKREAR